MPKLHFTDKNFSGRVYELVVERTSVGRGEHNTLVIADDSVSLNHCDILTYGEEVIVRERGSSNGTFVDGVRVNGQMPVHSGQAVRFGAVEARVEIEPARTSDTSTDLTAVYEYGKLIRQERREKKKAAAAHLRIEPSTAAPPANPDDQTVLLPNPRSTQRLTTPAPAQSVTDRLPKPPAKRTRYLVAAVLALIVVILIALLRGG